MGWSQDYLAPDALTGDSTVSVSGMLWFHTVQYRHGSRTHMHQLNTCGLGRSTLASSSCVCVCVCVEELSSTPSSSYCIILFTLSIYRSQRVRSYKACTPWSPCITNGLSTTITVDRDTMIIISREHASQMIVTDEFLDTIAVL